MCLPYNLNALQQGCPEPDVAMAPQDVSYMQSVVQRRRELMASLLQNKQLHSPEGKRRQNNRMTTLNTTGAHWLSKPRPATVQSFYAGNSMGMTGSLEGRTDYSGESPLPHRSPCSPSKRTTTTPFASSRITKVTKHARTFFKVQGHKQLYWSEKEAQEALAMSPQSAKSPERRPFR